MKRLQKALPLPVRNLAYRRKYQRLSYWVDRRLHGLQPVCVMPQWYYRLLYVACMRLVAINHCKRFADRAIHTIPYHLRFQMA